MDIQLLQDWIQHPELLNKDSLYELRKLLARYPYFQGARLLYLKNLYILHDTSFRSELRKSALFVSDLSVLFYYIEGEKFDLRQEDTGQADAKSDSPDRTLDLIDRFLSDMPLQSEGSVLSPVEASVDYTSVLQQEVSGQEAAVPLKGQELIDHFIERAEETPEALLPEQPAQESEGTAAEKAECKEDGKEETEEESYFTETLAKIYVKQHRYDKALEIIRKLNLKYPKKNAYFADQIRFLEKLIINVNSK